MEKLEFSEGSDSSEASFDFTEAKLKMQQLAETLTETNQNLHTSEFMLNQIQKVAKVKPVQNSYQNSSNKLIEDELQKIASSIKTLENQTSALPELKSQLSQRSEEVKNSSQTDK